MLILLQNSFLSITLRHDSCSIGNRTRKPLIYAGLDNFCVVIPYSSMRRTIPVAFIYKNSLLYKFVLFVSVKQGDLYLKGATRKRFILLF